METVRNAAAAAQKALYGEQTTGNDTVGNHPVEGSSQRASTTGQSAITGDDTLGGSKYGASHDSPLRSVGRPTGATEDVGYGAADTGAGAGRSKIGGGLNEPEIGKTPGSFPGESRGTGTKLGGMGGSSGLGEETTPRHGLGESISPTSHGLGESTTPRHGLEESISPTSHGLGESTTSRHGLGESTSPTSHGLGESTTSRHGLGESISPTSHGLGESTTARHGLGESISPTSHGLGESTTSRHGLGESTTPSRGLGETATPAGFGESTTPSHGLGDSTSRHDGFNDTKSSHLNPISNSAAIDSTSDLNRTPNPDASTTTIPSTSRTHSNLASPYPSSTSEAPTGPTEPHGLGRSDDTASHPGGGISQGGIPQGDNLTGDISGRRDNVSNANERTGNTQPSIAFSTSNAAPNSAATGIGSDPGHAVEPSVGADPTSGVNPAQKQQGGDRPTEEPSDTVPDLQTHGGRRKSLVHEHDDTQHLPAKSVDKLPTVAGTGDGSGQTHVKTSGVAAEGGDFDATKPGAGREANRLMDQMGIAHGDNEGKSGNPEDEGGKKGLGEKVKEKLHIGHKK